MIFIIIFTLGLRLTQSSSPIVRESDGFFRCPIDPITLKYPDPNDNTCHHYFLCHRGHAFPMTCGLRHAFHPAIGGCIPREEVPESVCKYKIKCGFNGFYPDPKDCSKYFICFYQQPVHFSCEAEHIFDASKSLCIWDKESYEGCSKTKPLPHFDTTISTTTQSTTMRTTILTKNEQTTAKKVKREDMMLDPNLYGQQRVMVL